jgi:GntR family transcriptional regulator, transcriptional repressor for pyruvate dehydrogenase complex
MDLIPIVKRTSAQQVAEQLLGMIRRGILKTGDQLPSERELIGRLEVGRSSVREGLQILATLNIIQSSPGQGTFIKEPRSDDILRADQIGFLINNAVALDLLEAREMIEPQSVRLACLRAEESDLRRIETLLDAHETALGAGRSTGEHAAKFHVLLAEASRNRVFVTLMRSILDLLQARGRGTRLSDKLRQLELGEHREILRLVRNREAQAAADFVTSHIIKWAVHYDVAHHDDEKEAKQKSAKSKKFQSKPLKP